MPQSRDPLENAIDEQATRDLSRQRKQRKCKGF